MCDSTNYTIRHVTHTVPSSPCFHSSCVYQDNDEICIQLGLCNSTKVETGGRVSLVAKPQAPKVFEMMLYIVLVYLLAFLTYM